MMNVEIVLYIALLFSCCYDLPTSKGFQAPTTQRRVRSSLHVLSRDASTSSSSLISTTTADPVLGKPPVLDTLQQQSTSYRTGILTIGFCTLVFASLSPVNHFALSGDQPLPVLHLNAIVSVVALASVSLGGRFLERLLPESPQLVASKQDMPGSTSWRYNPWLGGAELGFWKTSGTVANLYGLSLTTADHGAFLIQLTTILVPMVQGIMGVPISKRIQTSILLALCGIFLFTQDHTAVTINGSLEDSILTGDLLCILAAVFYATYDLRLFQWGQRIPARPLMTGKISTQAVLSLGLLVVGGGGLSQTTDLLQHTETWCTPTLVALLLWSGCMVNALIPFLQVGGQQAIGPTTSQTIYSSQPLWAALMSYVWFGETVGPIGVVGGGAFLAALFLAATAPPPETAKPVSGGDTNCNSKAIQGSKSTSPQSSNGRSRIHTSVVVDGR